MILFLLLGGPLETFPKLIGSRYLRIKIVLWQIYFWSYLTRVFSVRRLEQTEELSTHSCQSLVFVVIALIPVIWFNKDHWENKHWWWLRYSCKLFIVSLKVLLWRKCCCVSLNCSQICHVGLNACVEFMCAWERCFLLSGVGLGCLCVCSWGHTDLPLLLWWVGDQSRLKHKTWGFMLCFQYSRCCLAQGSLSECFVVVDIPWGLDCGSVIGLFCCSPQGVCVGSPGALLEEGSRSLGQGVQHLRLFCLSFGRMYFLMILVGCTK